MKHTIAISMFCLSLFWSTTPNPAQQYLLDEQKMEYTQAIEKEKFPRYAPTLNNIIDQVCVPILNTLEETDSRVHLKKREITLNDDALALVSKELEDYNRTLPLSHLNLPANGQLYGNLYVYHADNAQLIMAEELYKAFKADIDRTYHDHYQKRSATLDKKINILEREKEDRRKSYLRDNHKGYAVGSCTGSNALNSIEAARKRTFVPFLRKIILNNYDTMHDSIERSVRSEFDPENAPKLRDWQAQNSVKNVLKWLENYYQETLEDLVPEKQLGSYYDCTIKQAQLKLEKTRKELNKVLKTTMNVNYPEEIESQKTFLPFE